VDFVEEENVSRAVYLEDPWLVLHGYHPVILQAREPCLFFTGPGWHGVEGGVIVFTYGRSVLLSK
jgi:hypothetical protein